jgi:signal peptidase II
MPSVRRRHEGNQPITVSSSSKRNTIIFVISIAAVVALDQISKAVVAALMSPGQNVKVVPHLLWLTYSTNTGAAFGLFKGSSQVLFFTSLILVAMMLAWFMLARQRMGTFAFIGMGLIIGGAMGNLLDRIFRGRIIDYIDLGWWPVFNVADIAILAGAIIVLVVYTRELWREGDRQNPSSLR